jgi:serine/threonine-protein kinase
MPAADIGASEWFVWDLRQSRLIEPDQVEQVVGEFLAAQPDATPRALADHLVGRGLLTPFQADRVLEGKTDGFVLGPFVLMDVLGAGSMGTVYKARSKTDGRWYAVKMLPRRSVWHVRLARRNVRVFEKIQHPSVVPFLDVGTSAGTHFLAWPLVEGDPLDCLVARQGPLPPGQAAALAVQAAEGLDLCHREGLFHGLVKPSNLMLGADGSLRILDFGIGCLLAELEEDSLVDTSSTANAITRGLDCGSPESILDPKNLTPLGDQYSLGCVLYFLLTGGYPFRGEAMEKIIGHQSRNPTPVRELAPAVPEGLAAVVARLMAKAPGERYASAGEAAAALRPFAAAPAARPEAASPAPAVRPAPAVAAAGPSPAPAAVPLPPVPPSPRVEERRAPAPAAAAPAGGWPNWAWALGGMGLFVLLVLVLWLVVNYHRLF